MIYYDVKRSKWGTYTIVAHNDRGLCLIHFWNQMDGDLDDYLASLFPEQEVRSVCSPQFALNVIAKLENDDLADLSTSISTGTEFQRQVWHAVSTIPRGKTSTYGEVAQLAGFPSAIRAVATAVGNNPLPILIPCHRVVPKSGGIGKYRYSSAMKQELLARETPVCPSK